MQDILKLFPSVDGNEEKQQLLLESMQKIIKNLDRLKNEERATLGTCEEKIRRILQWLNSPKSYSTSWNHYV